MNKKLLTTLCCLGFAIALYGQNGWLPPDHFNGNTNLCDNTPWKLVFWDNFDGTQIDPTKWIKHVSWSGMPGGDNDNWDAARGDAHMNYIYRDQNVVVNNGTVKLLVKRETVNWTCNSCPTPTSYRKHTSAGALASYYTLPNGFNNGFNNGRIEARISFPLFKGAWCAFWTWYADKVNEIDIAEAWGGPIKLVGSDTRRNKYGTHAWGPKSGEYNPLQLPYDAAMGGDKFPNQGWWAWMFSPSSYHRQDAPHIYACEWDDNVMKFYIDNSLLNTYWKYIKNEGHAYNGHNYNYNVGSGCYPQPVTPYYTNFGYPYNTNSRSQIRLMTGADGQVEGLNFEDNAAHLDSVLHPNLLGQMEVDYVRVWQRHLELEGRTDVCALNQPEPVITGPDFVCNGNNITFTVANPVPGGSFNGWNYSNQLSLSSPPNSSSITITANSQSPYSNGWISYKYQLPNCPVQKTVYKSVSCNLKPFNPSLYDVYMIQTNTGNGLRQFQLFEGTHFANYEQGPYKPTFEWDIDVVDGNDECVSPQNYKLNGQFVSTPFLEVQENKNYCVKWNVKITDPQKNVVVKSGERHLGTPHLAQRDDNSIVYLDAIVTDNVAYEQAVDNRVKAKTVSEDESNDSIFINSMIEQVRVEELAPYLNVNPAEFAVIAKKALENSVLEKSKLYPNPTSGNLSIKPADEFADNMDITIRLFDVTGKLQLQEKALYNLGKIVDINLGQLTDGLYIMEICQGERMERHKVVKRAGHM
jgi:beta-glucanase (GH16 family)